MMAATVRRFGGHDQIRPYYHRIVQDEAHPTEGDVAGKINMGVGGINACAICRRW